ncbi:Scavenger receptor cysteine-rich type 1 protein M130 [Geodia barretti]|nr:Scavenger receptor cysteine-rich type 1 protein M130 [Geodia barretti]
MAGRLEIYINTANRGDGEDNLGEWGTVNGRKFGLREANVACRQLGFYSASHWNYSIYTEFGVGNGTIFLSGLKCSSRYQQHLLRCKHSGIGSPTYHYTHDQDVAIFCNPVPIWSRPYKGQVRLISSNLTRPSSGRVEVHQKNQWGTVCASAMSQGAADSVCRQLGFTNALGRGISSEPGSGVIWVGETSCSGSRRCFTSCFQSHKHTYGCNHTQDSAISCTFDFSKKSKSAGNKSACKITGFPLSQLIFYVCGGLALFLLLAFVGILVVAMGYKIKKKLSQKNYDTLQ